MSDKEIKKIVKDSLTNYQIKTTSNDILNTLKAKENLANVVPKAKKTPWYKTKTFIYGTPTLLVGAAALSIAFIVPSGSKNSNVVIDNSNNILKVNSRNNQSAFSVFSGFEIINGLDEITNNVAPVLDLKNIKYFDDDDDLDVEDSDDDDDDENENETDLSYTATFKESIDVFDPCVLTLESLFGESVKLNVKTENGSFSGKYATYPYRQIISFDEKVYTFLTNVELNEEKDDDEIETEKIYKGEIETQDKKIYQVESTISKESEVEQNETENEDEIDTTIYIKEDKTSYLTINQENEVEIEDGETSKEKSYVYSLVENNKKIYEEKISFEQEDKNSKSEVELSLSVSKNNKKYNFSQIILNNDKSLTSLIKVGSYKNSLLMIYENNNRVYTSKDGEIVKK